MIDPNAVSGRTLDPGPEPDVVRERVRGDERTPERARHATPWRRLWRPPLLAGLLVALCVLIVGIGYVLSTPISWSAHRDVVIVPGSTDVTEAASLYDSLSRGQVVATAAELYGESRWHPDTPTVTVVSGNIPPSAVIQVTASGHDRDQVEATLQTVITDATPQINELLSPYRAVVLETGQPVAHETGLTHSVMIVIVVLAALLAGAAAAGLTNRFTRRRERVMRP